MHIIRKIQNIVARGLAWVLLPLCLLMVGCQTSGVLPPPEDALMLRVYPDAVTLGEDQRVVVLSVEDTMVDAGEASLFTWEVEDPALGRITMSRGRTAVYRRESFAGNNRVSVRDQHGNRGQVGIQQTGGGPPPAVPAMAIPEASVSSSRASAPAAGEDAVQEQGQVATPAAASEPASGSVERARYTLLVGDEIELEVFREPDLSGKYRVEHGGVIRHVLLGSIQLAGLTVLQAEARITKLLSERFLVNPRVTVRVLSSQASQVLVMGEVKSPGARQIPFGERTTLLEVIAAAGGFTDLASVNRVRIIRQEDGRQKQIRVRVGRIVSGSDPDVEIFPNDVITVPQTFF